MNRETGMILRARKMAREQASRYFAPGEPGYQAKFEEIYTRLMREQLAFEDFRDKRGLSRNPTTPLCPFCGTRMKLRPSTWRVYYICPDPDCGYPGGTPAELRQIELTTDSGYDAPEYVEPDYRVSPSSPTARRNPPEDIDPTPYERFHGVPPDRVEERKGWVPGEMVLLGQAIDEGYIAKDRRSSKGDGPYVHDNGSGVRVWRRAKSGETPNKVWSNFPTELTLIGAALGFTYRDDNGKLHEVSGRGKEMHTPKSRRMVIITDKTGVKYVIEGGNLYVDDWIRN